MNRVRTTTLFCFLAIFGYTSIISANVQQSFQSWNKVKFRAHLPNRRFLFSIETDLRLKFNQQNIFNEDVNRYALGYSLNRRAALWLGYAIIPSHSNSLEQRIWQDLTWRWYQTRSISLSSRTRLEERWRIKTSGSAWRLRERINLSLPLITARCRPAIFDEFFFNLNLPEWLTSGNFAQNRFFAGLSWRIGKKTNFLIGYLNRFKNTISLPEIDHVVYLKLYVTLN